MHGNHGLHVHAKSACACLGLTWYEALCIPIATILEEIEDALEVGSVWAGLVAHGLVLSFMAFTAYWTGARLIPSLVEGLYLTVPYIGIRLLLVWIKDYLRNQTLFHSHSLVGEKGSLLLLSDGLGLLAGIIFCLEALYNHRFDRATVSYRVMAASLVIVPVLRLVFFMTRDERVQVAGWVTGLRSSGLRMPPYDQLTLILEELLQFYPTLLFYFGCNSDGIATLLASVFLLQETGETVVGLWRLRGQGHTLPETLGGRLRILLSGAILGLVHYLRGLSLRLLASDPLCTLGSRSYYSFVKIACLQTIRPVRRRLQQTFFLFKS